MTNSTLPISTFPIIDQFRLGQLEATITTAIVSRDGPDGIAHCDYILEIRRDGDDTLLAPHQYTLSDLPIIEKMITWAYEEIMGLQEIDE